MSQFDVHWLRSGEALVVDCQSPLLEELNTRLVIPLLAKDVAPQAAARLNPTFRIGEREYVLATQFAAAVLGQELGDVVASLSDRSFEVVGALDVLISGV